MESASDLSSMAEELMEKDRRDNTYIPEYFYLYKQPILDMLEQLSPISDGYLSRPTLTNHPIARNAPDVLPVKSAAYGTGQDAPSFEKEETEKNKKMGVKEPLFCSPPPRRSGRGSLRTGVVSTLHMTEKKERSM